MERPAPDDRRQAVHPPSGFSYGTCLGNVYANLFPDRVRAVAIDGLLDPVGMGRHRLRRHRCRKT